MFGHFGQFPRAFGQVRACLVSELQKKIRVSFAVACPIVFIFVCDQDRERKSDQTYKNGLFKVFSAVVVGSLKIFGKPQHEKC